MDFKLTFSGPRQPDTYFAGVNALIESMKPASLRKVAQALNDAGYTTPSGLSWDRTRLSGFIRTPRTTH